LIFTKIRKKVGNTIFILKIIMAKGKSTGSGSVKISFGKRKSGKAAKSRNRHDRGEKKYRGQGR
jgi:hypothetical protein